MNLRRREGEAEAVTRQRLQGLPVVGRTAVTADSVHGLRRERRERREMRVKREGS